ncbi:uncharacterized protein [Centroberyx affinis]|uniref:uncharacterized protein n=1 Tax=Centroberyx affinis TaxID=166261 RepID=UPI003A5C2D33
MAGVAVFWLMLALSLALPTGAVHAKKKNVPANSPAGSSQPNAGPSQPNAGPSQPNVGPSQPNVGPSQPNAGPSQPNAGPSQPNVGPSQPKAGPSQAIAGTSAGDSIDQNKLHQVMQDIWSKYDPRDDLKQYSLAIIVPFKNGKLELQKLQTNDPPSTVRNSLFSNQVYVGDYIVGAKPGETKINVKNQEYREHSEYLVLKQMESIKSKPGRTFSNKPLDQNTDYQMIFYTYFSPCPEPCADTTHDRSILKLLHLIKAWPQHTLVFTRPFQPGMGKQDADKTSAKQFTPEELKTAIRHIAKADEFGIANIFRCDDKACVTCEWKKKDEAKKEEDDDWQTSKKKKTSIEVNNQCVQGEL